MSSRQEIKLNFDLLPYSPNPRRWMRSIAPRGGSVNHVDHVCLELILRRRGGVLRRRGARSRTPPLRKARQVYLEMLVSLPQHSGRAGRAERSQPPPRAWTRVTASTMRRPRIFTAVSSSVRAAL